MSVGHTITGLAALGLGAQLLLTAILPDVKPITVHSLTYSEGIIEQDRTITTDAPFFYATWRAQIIDAGTGKAVPGCVGSGSWNYTQGRSAIAMPVKVWVGSDDCELTAGSYRPIAAWLWGSDQEVHRGEVFTIYAENKEAEQ